MSPATDHPGVAEPAGDIRIDRLALQVAGLDEDKARRLAQLVAEGLAPGMIRAAGGARSGGLQVTMTADPAAQDRPDLLAQRIVDEIERALARGRANGGPEGESVP